MRSPGVGGSDQGLAQRGGDRFDHRFEVGGGDHLDADQVPDDRGTAEVGAEERGPQIRVGAGRQVVDLAVQ
ncbi:hypothetical protein OG302_09415 [Streptomyces sp. NBC_01283]|nr:hypothetical protein OG302_09415 [Streptomyces sp. NBC_01283]